MNRFILSLLLITGLSVAAQAIVTSQSACLWSTNTVRIYFDNALNSSAQFTTNYAFNPAMTSISSAAIRGAEKSVQLTFHPGVINGKKYFIQVSGLLALSTTRYTEDFRGYNPMPIFMEDFNRPKPSISVLNTPTGKWEDASLGAGNAVFISTMAKSGSFGFGSQINANTNAANCYTSLLGLSTFYIRFYAYFPTGYFSQLTIGKSVYFFAIEDTSEANLFTFSAWRDANRNYIDTYFDYDIAGTYSLPPIENRWYCFEVQMPSCTATAVIKWWVDGVAQPPGDPIDLRDWISWNYIYCGVRHSDGGQLAKNTVYLDELVVSSNPVGMIQNAPVRRRRPGRIILD